jgi:ABC-type multidrug transport system permease subunit
VNDEPHVPRPRAAGSQRLEPLIELTKMRLREFYREPGMIFWVFGFPILMAIGLGLAFRSQPPERPSVAVLAPPGHPLAQALVASDRLASVLEDEPAALRGLARTRYSLVLDLRGAEPVYRYDPMLRGAALARAVVDAELERAAGRRDVLTVRDELQSLPGTRYIDFLVPGLIALNLMGSSLWGVGYSMVVARKRKLLRRFAVTAMRRSDYLLSYFLSRLVFLALELGVLVTFGALAFGTVVQGSYLGLVSFALLGAAAFAGLGLLVGARVDSTEVAQGWVNFIQLPMWVLSGAYFSNEHFPGWLQPVIKVLPLTALVDALRRIYNEAASIDQLLLPLGVLAAWTLGSFGLAARTFRWQ